MKVLFTFLFFSFSVLTFAQEASLTGKVVDAVNNEPLPFVNVVVSGTSIGTTTDLDGNFLLNGLQPGFVRIEASFVGYKKAISSEIEVSVANTNFIEIQLEQQKEQIDEVTVTASPFRKTQESPVSLRSIGIGEIEKSPGANRDISKVIQSFAGVQSTPAFRNDIIIRGGGPSESRFYLDGVEVPFINHFATQGASGGPVGIINADFLREVNYYSGAFPANRGNALSGVLEFFQVDGNNDKLKFQGTLGASEVAATLDGPVGEKTTFVLSARRSYLQFLFSVLELPFLPNFTDTQFKIRTRFDKKNELTVIGLGAFDVFDLNLDIEDPDEQQKYILSQIPVNEQWSYTLGAVYKHFRENSYQTLVVSRSHLNNGAYKYFDNDDSSEENKILDYSSEEIENKIRFENTLRLNTFKLNFGANFDFVTYKNTTQQRRFYGDEILNVNYDAKLDLVKYGLFTQVSKNVLNERLALSLGIRADANNYAESMNNPLEQFSPRFSASYSLTDKWSLNFNTGKYYQLPSYTTLGFEENNVFVNRENKLKYITVDHLIAGLEFRPRTTVQFSLEGFWKGYANYPFSVKDQISLANKGADYGVVGDEEVISSSEGRAYGAEFQARVNSTKGFNFNLSYTLVRSEFQDAAGEYIPSSWDSKHLLNVTTTKDLKKNWRIGARWRFVGGLPYTPYDMEKSSLVEAWNLKGSPHLDYSKLNSERFSAFHQLDLRVDKSFYLNKITAKFYLDIQNLYNHQAEQQDIVIRAEDANGSFVLTDNGSRYKLETYKNTSGTVLPTIGIIIEF
ncbi:TonB-dependent receptor plug domain-containing protein [Maribellus comscasis]|uniref:TonB-dependent receptor plug domain-containing protein n=1 Tax=Maribellus comscasis TaxID=2681766 RepID=A0A6I6K314_9BACT|nr:TonB-dependent receptor [Maribellus comscasis]QGY44314.1 TonB-dependent receptor plug domain-containing protein [Maribellus comscasis]